MSATTQPKTFSDLYTSLLNKVREQTSVTATSNQAKAYINTALQDMVTYRGKSNRPDISRGPG